jgi:MFS family permease
MQQTLSSFFDHLYYMTPHVPKYILPVIVLAQFCCTSLWFAGNGVASELAEAFDMDGAIGPITLSVQLGFIIGTLAFAIFKIADRFAPSRVFMICAGIGAITNLSIIWMDQAFLLIALRFATGFFLAGIYPVGMKIASDYHERGLGLALGYLVGALVVGTASPHLIRLIAPAQSWELVLISTSCLSIVGGLLLGITVPDGPYRKKSAGIDMVAFVRVFKYRKFRGAALGYFGHMWELYAFWAFIPLYIQLYISESTVPFSVSGLSFLTIAAGGFGCVVGGYLSMKIGSERVAGWALFSSLVCILVSPFVLILPCYVFIPFLVVWGMAVIIDSPQFSSAAAANAPKELTGTALTIMNSIGFAITLVSISLLSSIQVNPYFFWLLVPGPFIGLLLFWVHLYRSNGLSTD